MNSLLTFLAMLWASPYTLVGLVIGAIGLCTGGKARIRGRTIEFWEGGVKWFVTHMRKDHHIDSPWIETKLTVQRIGLISHSLEHPAIQ